MPKDVWRVSLFRVLGYTAFFLKCGEKSETSEHNPIFANKTAGHKCKTAVWSIDLSFHRIPEAFVSGMRQALEPLSATVFRVQESQVDALCHSGMIGLLFLLILFLSYLAAIVVLPQR